MKQAGVDYSHRPSNSRLKSHRETSPRHWWESHAHKSRPKRADAQKLVTTRLLDYLHDPLARLGRLQRIHPRATRNDNPSTRRWRFRAASTVDPFRYRARRPIRIQLRRAGFVSSGAGTDSDLEAFSHNPADGSFAALPCQTAAKTNYLNQRFLSY
jgi:hypothetical protein